MDKRHYIFSMRDFLMKKRGVTNPPKNDTQTSQKKDKKEAEKTTLPFRDFPETEKPEIIKRIIYFSKTESGS